MKTLGEHLRQLRESRGFSATQLAAGTGLSRSYLWELETGRVSDPTLSTLVAIAGELGVALVDLLPPDKEIRRRTKKGGLAVTYMTMSDEELFPSSDSLYYFELPPGVRDGDLARRLDYEETQGWSLVTFVPAGPPERPQNLWVFRR